MKSEKKFSIKKLLWRLFGKARWYLLGMGICLLILGLISIWSPDRKSSEALSDKLFGEERQISDIIGSSVDRDGDILVLMNKSGVGISALIHMDTNEQIHATLSEIKRDGQYAAPDKQVLGDDHHYYGFIYEYDKETDIYIVGERLVEISETGDYIGDICYVEYPKGTYYRDSIISKPVFQNGILSFSVVGLGETRLYEIETRTQNVRISDPYAIAEDGTYTQKVIPLGKKYLFLQSNGKYYLTGFNEPLTECIYEVKTNPSKRDAAYFVNLAAMVDDRLYVTKNAHDGKIFVMEDQEMKEVLDLHDHLSQYGEVVPVLSLEAFVSQTTGREELAITLLDGFVTYDGDKVSEKYLTYHVRNGWLWWVSSLCSILLLLCTIGLLINIIIRRKTLLYKQLVFTIPILLIPAGFVIRMFYADMEEDTTAKTEQEITMASSLAAEVLEGYDFSGFDQMNDHTGTAALELSKKLQAFDGGKYVFWVVSLSESGKNSILARSDTVSAPGFFKDNVLTASGQEQIHEELMNNGHSFYQEITGLFSKNVRNSKMVSYRQLANPKGSCPAYILRVSSDTWNLWTTRRDLFIKVSGYIFLIVLALIVMTVFTSWYITRTIKKAKGTVHKIAGGDFSARVDYRSKDELGEICAEVNTMTESLEEMFNEKDRTEKFYYKFVPEKFRELLGKEKFTDLALGDARSRDLTVLFFDIRAFSINSETMTAKENFEFVNTIYGKAGPVIREHNGFVDKYIGDAVMALFENADDAVLCGIELYRKIVLDKSTAEEIGIGDVSIGIGVHSGMTRIGIVGESERLSGTVISDTVNLSSRLESLTKQYHTAMLITKDTVDRMTDPDALKMRYLGELQVAGVNEVKAVYEVLDCLPEEEGEKRYRNAAEFREAVRLFHLSRREEAIRILSDLSKDGRNDSISDMYLAYIGQLPEDETGNVFRFVRK